MNVLGTALGVSLVVVWFGVLGATVRAVVKKDVLWRGVGEDRDEGGFRNPKRLAVGKIEEGPV